MFIYNATCSGLTATFRDKMNIFRKILKTYTLS